MNAETTTLNDGNGNPETNEIAVYINKMGVLQAASPKEVIVVAKSIALELKQIITDLGLSKKIGPKEYVYIEAWTTMGAMMGVLPREDKVIKLDGGGYQATVELSRISDGAIIGRASAECGTENDGHWINRPAFQVRSMAITRATGKAYRLGFSWIMTLAGYAGTPVEEFDDGKKASGGKRKNTDKAESKGSDVVKILGDLIFKAVKGDIETAKDCLFVLTGKENLKDVDTGTANKAMSLKNKIGNFDGTLADLSKLCIKEKTPINEVLKQLSGGKEKLIDMTPDEIMEMDKKLVAELQKVRS